MSNFFEITEKERKLRFNELKKFISENSAENYSKMYIVWFLSHTGIFESLQTGTEVTLFSVMDEEGIAYQLNGIVTRIDVISLNDYEVPDKFFLQLQLDPKEVQRLNLSGSKVCVWVRNLLDGCKVKKAFVIYYKCFLSGKIGMSL